MDTKMHRSKRLGERGMARTFEQQVNELHIRAAVLNQFTELGCPQMVTAAQPRLGSVEVWPSLIYATAPIFPESRPCIIDAPRQRTDCYRNEQQRSHTVSFGA